jgi:RNA ligase (TIGR02306 family)
MSTDYKVPYTRILNISEHPGADRLSIAQVYGFAVVVRKDQYKVGDEVIYIPVDSIIPIWLEQRIFGPDSKIKLHHQRVKQIRIRAFPSQGLILDPKLVEDKLSNLKLEFDVSEVLEITKYEPPTPSFQTPGSPKLRDRPLTNPYFRTYNGIGNIKWMPDMFDGQEVELQEKLHGSHIRWGKAPFVANTLWKKVKKLFRMVPKFEEVYGSNKVELTNRSNFTGYYGSDVYGACLQKLNAFDRIKDGEFWHGELIGPGIQKGYTYGHKEHDIVVFDVRILQEDGTQKWLNPEEAEKLAKERGFDFVPVLYKGPFSKDVVNQHISGPSVYDPNELIREGCVVKSRYEYDQEGNKTALKCINPDYLDGDHGDNH